MTIHFVFKTKVFSTCGNLSPTPNPFILFTVHTLKKKKEKVKT